MLGSRSADGFNVAVVPLTPTTPTTEAPPAVLVKVNEAELIVELVIASENVADTEAFSAIPVAPEPGLVLDTVGGVVSAEVVMKFQE